jgi:hypothetical protein
VDKALFDIKEADNYRKNIKIEKSKSTLNIFADRIHLLSGIITMPVFLCRICFMPFSQKTI